MKTLLRIFVLGILMLGLVSPLTAEPEKLNWNSVSNPAQLYRYLSNPDWGYADHLMRGATSGANITWDSSVNKLHFGDDAILCFGNTVASPDSTLSWDGTDLNLVITGVVDVNASDDVDLAATDDVIVTAGDDITITGSGVTTISPVDDVYIGVQKTVIKSISMDDDASADDFQFDDDAANTTEQPVDFGALIPAYAEIVSVQIRCIEAVVGGTMSIDIGVTTGADDVLAAVACDALNEVFGGAAASAPIIGVTNAARNIWVNATPSANWNILTAGRYVVIVTYLDYGAVYTADSP